MATYKILKVGGGSGGIEDQKVDVWEEFDEKFVDTGIIWDCYNDIPAPEAVKDIKDFIKTNFIAKSAVREIYKDCEGEDILVRIRDLLDSLE